MTTLSSAATHDYNAVSYTHLDEEEMMWGFILMAYEEGYKDDPDKTVACLCEVVFRNAGYHELAEQARKQARKMIEGQQ